MGIQAERREDDSGPSVDARALERAAPAVASGEAPGSWRRTCPSRAAARPARHGRGPRVGVVAAFAALSLLASPLWAAVDTPENSTADSAGYGAPGYPKFHLGQAMVQRGEMQVRLHTRIELRFGILTGDDSQLLRGDYAERMGFGMPRARFGLQGQFADKIPFAVVTDLAGNRLTDAWIGYERFRFFKMWFGARTVPFSRSAILSSADAALSERSRAADAMAPFRQVGLTFGGDYDLLHLTWRFGVYNGFDRHEAQTFYGGAVNGSGLHGNKFHGLSMVGRLQIQPLGRLGPSVHDLKGGKLRLSLGGGAYANDGGATDGVGYSADLHVKAAGLHLLAEFIRDEANPKQNPTTAATIPEQITRQAMSLELGYVFHKLTFALRTELIDANTAVQDNDDELWVSAAVGRVFVGNLLRAWLQYDHRRETAGQPYDNDTLHFKIMLRL